MNDNMKPAITIDTRERHPRLKQARLTLLTAVLLAGCDSGEATTGASRDCTRITSALERLACFDSVARTPPTVPVRQQPVAPEPVEPEHKSPLIKDLVDANEAGRLPDETQSRITRSADRPVGQDKVVISAPALTGPQPHAHLAISCLSNISRLQLLSSEPLPVNYITIRLVLDGKPVASARPWQVLDDGTVSDAGRGLVAIEQLRHLTQPARLLTLESNYSPFDGLQFDARALGEQIAEQREACHW